MSSSSGYISAEPTSYRDKGYFKDSIFKACAVVDQSQKSTIRSRVLESVPVYILHLQRSWNVCDCSNPRNCFICILQLERLRLLQSLIPLHICILQLRRSRNVCDCSERTLQIIALTIQWECNCEQRAQYMSWRLRRRLELNLKEGNSQRPKRRPLRAPVLSSRHQDAKLWYATTPKWTQTRFRPILDENRNGYSPGPRDFNRGHGQ